jgi:hypothetical protein
VVTCGDDCWVRLFEKASGELFAECPLPLDKPLISVRPPCNASGAQRMHLPCPLCFCMQRCRLVQSTISLCMSRAEVAHCKHSHRYFWCSCRAPDVVLTSRWWSLLWTAAGTTCSALWTAHRSATPLSA